MKKSFLIFLIISVFIIPIFAENKTALVIGNGNYAHFSRLANPKKEATDMKNALQRLGFEVIILIDGTENQIADALYEFEMKLEQRGGLALFHYGGHGVQVKGSNYIIPVDANIPDERRVKANAVDLDEILGVMDVSGSRTNIVILDACRDNPLPGASRSSSRGLARVDNPPPDSIIVYSADAGTTAEDGLFTPTLLKYLETPGMEFSDMLRSVRSDVINGSGGKQRTGEYNQLVSEIYLAGASGTVTKKPGFQMDAATYGSIKLSLAEKGTVYVDGVHMGSIDGGRSATLSDIITGSHQIDIRYGSHSEQRSIQINENKTASATFNYKAPVETPQSNDRMVHVQGGTFQMGSIELRDYEKPVHRVTLSDFYISKYEVTQGEYKALMGKSPSNSSKGIGDNYPVNTVSWNEAVEYCNALSRKEGLTPAYSGSGNNVSCNFNANGYRLPTEAEWEYAARGGQNSRNYNFAGSNNLENIAWHEDNSGSKTHPVGQKQANELGLYDMTGNVWEWCWDWYERYSSGSQSDPEGSSSAAGRIRRGGSWLDSAVNSHLAYRNTSVPSYKHGRVGFRVVRRL
jgi:formylglycine-generating enzyme required for sulfatase activity